MTAVPFMFNTLQACRAALVLDGGYFEAHKELIKAQLADKQYEDAVNTARNLLQQHQNDGELHQVRIKSGNDFSCLMSSPTG